MYRNQQWRRLLSVRLASGRRICSGIVLLLGVILINSVRAQQTISSAMLTRWVEDAAGGVVKGASVTVRNLETNLTSSCTCDDRGLFRFPYLTVGTYEFNVEAPGFAEPADLPVLETVRTQLTERVLLREIDSLPLNGRNYGGLGILMTKQLVMILSSTSATTN